MQGTGGKAGAVAAYPYAVATALAKVLPIADTLDELDNLGQAVDSLGRPPLVAPVDGHAAVLAAPKSQVWEVAGDGGGIDIEVFAAPGDVLAYASTVDLNPLPALAGTTRPAAGCSSLPARG